VLVAEIDGGMFSVAGRGSSLETVVRSVAEHRARFAFDHVIT